jgi:folate-binding protein YgfZ
MLNAWLQFLTRHGAQVDEQSQEVIGFPAGNGKIEDGFISPLSGLGLIQASGEEAAVFLHNQLTNDVEHLGLGETRLAGYCSPKGRLLATFLMWKSADGILLELPRQIQPAVQKRLQMFILRAKVKLADMAESHVILGIGGAQAGEVMKSHFPQLPTQPHAKVDTDAGTLIRVADAFGAPRYQWIAPREIAEAAWPGLVAALTPVAPATWRLADIRAGMPQIVQATQEQFVPQMVNFEVVGGVNFKKGCYPGQEIVARSQYLGKLKRRMVLANIDATDAQAGAEVYSSTDPDQPCGMIVNAEHSPAGGSDCLVEIKLTALDAGTVHLGSASGPALRFLDLPYALPDAAA